jgi:UDP-N-acetylglucosamine 2-epimerase (non-hydrolysing)
MHRPSNVDGLGLLTLVKQLVKLAESYTILFPVHPRTKQKLEDQGLLEVLLECLNLVKPMGYVQFMAEVFNCHAVITDSGGIQEETSYLGIPCFTVRNNTERQVTINRGTNSLIELQEVSQIQYRSYDRTKTSIPLWDGYTAGRIVKKLKEVL